MKNISIKSRLIGIFKCRINLFCSWNHYCIYQYDTYDGGHSELIYNVRLKGLQHLVEADRDAYQSNNAIIQILTGNDFSDSEKSGLLSDVESNLLQVEEPEFRATKTPYY